MKNIKKEKEEKPKIEVVYTKLKHPSGITADISEHSVSFYNSYGREEFVFHNSSKDTARKVLQAMLDLLK